MKKRIISFITVVFMVLSSLLVNSYAAGIDKIDYNGVTDYSTEAQGINNWYYQYGNGTNYDQYGMMVLSSGSLKRNTKTTRRSLKLWASPISIPSSTTLWPALSALRAVTSGLARTMTATS